MNTRSFSRLFALSASIALAALAAFAAPPPKNPPRLAGERQSVFLTVYNENLALVRELRTINLDKGKNRVWVPEIPATIDATSLHFTSLTDPGSVDVLEQNYQYDLVNQQKLLEKYIGKQVEFLRPDADKREVSVLGRLLAVDQSVGNRGSDPLGNPGLIAEVNGKIEVNPMGRLILPSLPEGLVLKPQLEWLLNSRQAGSHKSEITYLASSLSWSCDYVALLNKDDNRIDLTGWVTLVNHSGTAFKDAGLKLVAGDVNRVREEFDDMAANGAMALRKSEAAPQFSQRDLFEYKLYSLERNTDLANNESKQIQLVSATNAVARKILIYDGLDQGWRYWVNNPGYRSQSSMGQQSNPKVGVYVTFQNDEKSGLGLALPKGKVRVYKKDEDGKEQFVGEDKLDHTPKDEEVRLYLGNTFDVVGSRTQTDFRVISSGHVVEESFQIKVRNHKKSAAEVMVYEHPWRWSQWDVVKSNPPHEKVDQTTLRFPLKIEAGQEKTVIYTVRYTW